MLKFDDIVLFEAIKQNGHLQEIVAIEEMSELIKEISKNLRGEDNYKNIVEEMADVFIMLRQLQMCYFIGFEEIQEVVDMKTERLKQKLNNTQEE